MLPSLVDGNQSSAAVFRSLLSQVQTQGQQVLDDLETTYTETLFTFQQTLASLNGRNIRAVRVLSPDVCYRFTVADLLDIDQSLTSGTVRADAQTATLKERSQSIRADILQTTFSASSGTVERYDQVYSVLTSGSVPAGTFKIELVNPGLLSFLDFEILAMPSQPKVEVYVSIDGIVETPARQIVQNGYVINARFDSQPVKYCKVVLTPSMPDTLGGSTFSFGITSLSASLIEYVGYSELVTKPVSFQPVTGQVRFKSQDTGLSWFLQLGNGPVMPVNPEDVISIPGVEEVTVDTQINPSWQLCTGPLISQVPLAMPADVYPSSLAILDTVSNLPVRVAYGLDPNLLGQNLANTFVGVRPYVDGGGLYVVPVNSGAYVGQSGIVYQVKYAHGPQIMPARLFVHLSTDNPSYSPAFHGAWLENIY